MTGSHIPVKRRKCSSDFNVLEEPENAHSVSTVPGAIKKVVLKNFMCHSHLEVEFIPRVNIIVGNNGSGKSAILTAIAVCLGVRSVNTCRGKSFKDFIKAGTELCLVSVTLINAGNCAFQYDEYGAEIEITRTLRASGSSSYKIKDAYGKIKSQKKETVDAICSHLAIQPDNPLAILNQETSKCFLSSTNDKEKYRLFSKATLLDSISKLLLQVLDEQRVTLEIHSMKIKEITEIKNTQLKFEKELREHSRIENWKSKLSVLNAEFFWARKKEAQNYFDKLEATRIKALKSIEDLKEKVDHGAKDYGKDISMAKLDIKCAHDKLDKLSVDIVSLNKTLEFHSSQIEKLNLDVQKKNNLIKTYKEQERVAQQEDKRHLELLSQKEKLDSSKSKLLGTLHCEKQSLKTKEIDWKHFQETEIKYKHQLEAKNFEINSVESRLNTARQHLNNIERQNHNQYSVYGKWMVRIVEEVEILWKEGCFVKKPLGPLGSFLNVKDKFWKSAIECCLSSLLFAFLIDNFEDLRRLESVIKKHTQGTSHKIQLIVQKFLFEAYSVDNKRVKSDELPCLMDILEFHNPDVFNCLVDQKHIESVVLFKNCEEGSSIMKNMKRVPKNCKVGYAASGQVIYPDPNFRLYSTMSSGTNVLVMSIRESLKLAKDSVSCLVKEKEKLQHEFDELNEHASENKKLLGQQKIYVEKCKKQIKKLELELQELNSTLEPVLTPQAIDSQDIVCHLERLHREKLDILGKIEEAKKERESLTIKIHEVKYSMSRTRQEYDYHKKAIASLETKQKESEELETLLKRQLSLKRNSYSELLLKCSAASENLKEQFADIPSSSLEEIKTERLPSVIENDIKILMKNIELCKGKLLDPNDLLKTISQLKKEYLAKRKSLDAISKFLKKLQHCTVKRNALYKVTRSHLSITIQFIFNSLMDSQPFKSQVIIDHEKEILSIKIEKGSTDNKSLSGGERSISTINLLIALWEVSKSPFRILDEFDVFMDMVNRRNCLSVLLQNAREKKNKQLILLTPQDISYLGNLKEPNFLKVLRLNDPLRN